MVKIESFVLRTFSIICTIFKNVHYITLIRSFPIYTYVHLPNLVFPFCFHSHFRFINGFLFSQVSKPKMNVDVTEQVLVNLAVVYITLSLLSRRVIRKRTVEEICQELDVYIEGLSDEWIQRFVLQ